MKEKIIDSIYFISTERAGIYSSLFGYEFDNLILNYTFNFSFENSQNINKDIQYFLDNIIAKMVISNDSQPEETGTNTIIYGEFKHNNVFIPNKYIINSNSKLCDIENYIDDIEVSHEDRFIHIKWALPIYYIS